MKEKKIFNTYTTFCVRTPLFPFSFYKELTNKSELLDHNFLEVLKNPIVKEAIYLASPELKEQLEKWEGGLITDRKKIERLQFSLLKYATRISSRCTPFGLFASCASGEFGKQTKIEFTKKQSHTRVTNFDMLFLSKLQQELLKDIDIKSHLLFYPNTSLYTLGNHYRYLEYTFKGNRREYSLEGFSINEYLDKIIEQAKSGKKINQLIQCLLDEETSEEEATNFIEELIENQILISELELTITGVGYFRNLLNVLKGIPKANKTYKWLNQLQKYLLSLDKNIGNPISKYEDMIESIQVRCSNFDTKYLLQTDSFSNLRSSTLNKNIIPQLEEAITAFSKMSIHLSNDKLEKFKKDFRKRYDDKEIPLNLILDPEIGIGYGDVKYDNSHFLGDIPVGRISNKYRQVLWSSFDDLMREKLFSAYKNNDTTITLTENDLEKFSEGWEAPDTFSSLIEVIPTFNNEKIYISNTGGSSSANLIGRFAKGDNKLYSQIQEIFDFEDQVNSDKIMAEIVHLPEARTGNVLQRSNQRNYEVVYLGKSSLNISRQILIEDIFVSVKQNKVVLKSKKLGKEIIPRLSNAHNYKGNPLPIYEFLCDLQSQDKKSSVGFYWNPILLKQDYLPRVEYKNLILSKEKWRIKVSDFELLCKNEDILVSINNWRNKNKIPNLVNFVEGDNKLLINLKNKNSILMLYNTVKKRRGFLLEEFLFKDIEGDDSYCNQYVISFYKDGKIKDERRN